MTEQIKTDHKPIKKTLVRILRWAVPIVILYFIFQYIDFDRLFQSMIDTNFWFMAIGLAHFPLLIFIAIYRWRFLLVHYHKRSVPMRFVSKHYWVGLALGFFTPGSIGLDAYRVVVSSRHYGQYINNTSIVLVEKLMALTTCMSIIVILYPMLPVTLDPKLEHIFYLAYALLIVSLISVGLLVIFTRIRAFHKLLEKLDSLFSHLVQRFLKRLNAENEFDASTLSFTTILAPFSSPNRLMIVVVLSFGIQFFSAVKSQIFFYALGYDLPFMVNLFVAPTLYFIFILPISFGSLGIREGAYIILYGLFGVPPEIALLVSFFNLSGMLFNNIIGGIVMLLRKKE
jgi:uncharacterized protein (TIRG00374 family)